MRKHFAVIVAASTAVMALSSAAQAVYTDSTTFQLTTSTPATSPNIYYSLSDPTNWTNGLPNGTKLAIVGPGAYNNGTTTLGLSSNLTAYAFSPLISPDTILNTYNSAVLTVLSTDSVYDTAAKTSPAFYASPSTNSFNIRTAVQLGDATTSGGTAYFVNSGNSSGLQMGNTIGQAAGQVWNVNIGGTSEVRWRGDANSSNYLLNRHTYTGTTTVNALANLRLQNNIQVYGVGTGSYTVNGTIARSVNAGANIVNAINGTGIITRTSGGGNAEFFVGANNGNGDFSGAITSNLRIFKVGTGTQSLGTGLSSGATTAVTTSTHAQNWVIDGVLSTPNTTTAMGGSTSVTTLDGGEFAYVGAGETTNSRIFNISYRGGTLSSSGSGPLVIAGGGTAVLTNTNIATAVGDASASGTNQVVQNAYGLKGLSAFTNKINVTGQQSTIAANSVATIDETARTIDLGAGNTVSAATTGNGAPVFTFTANQAIDRTLTLSGTNTGANTVGVVLSNEATFGAKLGVTKAGAGTWVLSGANTYTGTTTVNGGRLVVTDAAKAPILTNAGGADLQSGTLVLDYTGSTSSLAQVKSILIAGYAGNFATGQIRATSLAAGRTLGYGDNGTDSVTIRVTIPGDANLDGTVNFNDFLVLQANFGSADTRFDQGNFNYDGATNFNDFLLLQANFGQSVNGAAVFASASEVAAMTAFAAAVPEPTSLAVLGLGAAAALRRRRSR